MRYDMGEDNLDNSKIHIKGGHLHIDDFAKTHLTGWSNPTLFQNKPITRRIFVTDSYDKSIDTHYRKSSNKNRKFHTSVQDIHVWFQYLKLILEMEQNGLEFTKKKIDNPNKLDRSIIGKDIEIDKGKYVNWDLEQVLELPFSKWWKRHKDVFGSAKVKGVTKSYEMLILNYNIMVRYLNRQPNLDIFLEEKNRIREIRTSEHIKNKLDIKTKGRKFTGLDLWTTYTKWWKIRDEPDTEVKVLEYKGETTTREIPTLKKILEDRLITASQELVRKTVLETQDILLGVCEGSFVKKIKLTYDPKTGKRGIPKL